MRDPITGGSVYWLDDGTDTGPVLLQNWCHVRSDDTAQLLWRRETAPMGLRLFSQALAMLDARCRRRLQRASSRSLSGDMGAGCIERAIVRVKQRRPREGPSLCNSFALCENLFTFIYRASTPELFALRISRRSAGAVPPPARAVSLMLRPGPPHYQPAGERSRARARE
ncbi:hypothetical protein [Pseudomonas chlororaphis]